ncbi:carboxypeptidase S [Pluteus cervinus]|uniref:Carboxypeptidase S n=1 Tax=Pluteus cervinus TaxID=181527 RepID=A0ACD3B0Z2_9AGAR|nr:carboxypeptidase S [Pluteus cervinus]
MSTLQKKEPLLPSIAQEVQFPQQKPQRLSFRALLAVLGFVYLSLALTKSTLVYSRIRGDSRKVICPQAGVLTPQRNATFWVNLGDHIQSEAFKTRAIDWLAGAVQVPTESYDNMDPVGTDPRWEAFGAFHDYLSTAFPLVHATLQLTKVNTYGLLYTWKGSDGGLKPLLLMAHQDVVPVEPSTVDDWTHPPYSGHFDGELLWGRGSSDDKGSLIAILSSIEALLEQNFAPTRTVVLSFGFDEEASGRQGAGQLAEALHETYGDDAFAMVVDEGGGYAQKYGTVIASPAIAEKGYLDTRVEVITAGGHSSLPPTHTSIGILARLLVEFEENPFEIPLTRQDPYYWTLQCMAEHAPSLPHTLRKTIRHSAHSNKALHNLGKLIFKDPATKSLVGTTQAIDLIQGGVKTNALPERAWAVVNHRISTSSSVDATKAHDLELLRPLAAKFNLSYIGFDGLISEEGAPSQGTLKLSDAFGGALEPAPVTPTDPNSAPWQLLSGTIKATYNVHRGLEGSTNVAVSPSVMSGNTDTRYYWALSRHIFRYNHSRAGNGTKVLGGIHTVNENIEGDAYLEMIRFFTTLILNADEATSI